MLTAIKNWLLKSLNWGHRNSSYSLLEHQPNLHINTNSKEFSIQIVSPVQISPGSSISTPESAYGSPLSPTSDKLTIAEKTLQLILDLQSRLSEIEAGENSPDYYDTKPYIKALDALANLYKKDKTYEEITVFDAHRINKFYALPLLAKVQNMLSKNPQYPIKQHPSWTISWWKFWRAEHKDWRNILQAKKNLESALSVHIERALLQKEPFFLGDHKVMLSLMRQSSYRNKLCRLMYYNKTAFDNACWNFVTHKAKPEQCLEFLRYNISYAKDFLTKHNHLMSSLVGFQETPHFKTPFHFLLAHALTGPAAEVNSLLKTLLTPDITQQLNPAFLCHLVLTKEGMAKVISQQSDVMLRFSAAQLLTMAKQLPIMRKVILNTPALAEKVLTKATSEMLINIWINQPNFFKRLVSPNDYKELLFENHNSFSLAYSNIFKGGPFNMLALQHAVLTESISKEKASLAIQLCHRMLNNKPLKNWFEKQIPEETLAKMKTKMDEYFVWQKKYNAQMIEGLKKYSICRHRVINKDSAPEPSWFVRMIRKCC